MFEILLGTKTMKYETLRGTGLEPRADNTVPWRALFAAIEHGNLVLQDHVRAPAGRPGACPPVRLGPAPRLPRWLHASRWC